MGSRTEQPPCQRLPDNTGDVQSHVPVPDTGRDSAGHLERSFRPGGKRERALAMLDDAGLRQTEDDIKGSKAVLRAAAMTYLAAAVTSVLQLLYYISIAQRRS